MGKIWATIFHGPKADGDETKEYAVARSKAEAARQRLEDAVAARRRGVNSMFDGILPDRGAE